MLPEVLSSGDGCCFCCPKVTNLTVGISAPYTAGHFCEEEMLRYDDGDSNFVKLRRFGTEQKETKASGNGGCPYKKADACALTEDGELTVFREDFCASETLNHAWFASLEMLCIRLSPLCPRSD